MDKFVSSKEFLRELFLQALEPCVEDVVEVFCLHSLHVGASAAANTGIPDGLFKRHGRWLNAKDGHISDSFDIRLKVFVFRFIISIVATMHIFQFSALNIEYLINAYYCFY